MIFVLSGNDRALIGKHLLAIEAKERPDHTLRFADTALSEEFAPLLSESLFGEKTLAVVDGLSKFPEETRQFFLDHLQALHEHVNVFLLIDESFSAECVSAFRDTKISIEECKAKAERETVNPFTISDALFAGDKQKIWMAYHQALRGGAVAEELHGMLWWAIKSMILTSSGGNPDETGMKPFAYQKAKRGAEHYGKEKLQFFGRELVDVLERTRVTGGNLSVALERFLLKTISK